VYTVDSGKPCIKIKTNMHSLFAELLKSRSFFHTKNA
jgi:hypothetical protein